MVGEKKRKEKWETYWRWWSGRVFLHDSKISHKFFTPILTTETETKREGILKTLKFYLSVKNMKMANVICAGSSATCVPNMVSDQREWLDPMDQIWAFFMVLQNLVLLGWTFLCFLSWTIIFFFSIFGCQKKKEFSFSKLN